MQATEVIHDDNTYDIIILELARLSASYVMRSRLVRRSQQRTEQLVRPPRNFCCLSK
jgi:hypothetical protein